MINLTATPFILHKDLPSEVVPVKIDVLRPENWEKYKGSLTEAQARFADERKFVGDAGQRLSLPESDGRIKRILFGCGSGENDDIGEMRLGTLSSFLSDGYYSLGDFPSDMMKNLAAIGWGLGAYSFDRYLAEQSNPPLLVLSDEAEHEEIRAS